MSAESPHEKALGGKLLASVSRSFYLTIKALPRPVREPVSLAYLLARAADTIADTTQVPAEIRQQCLVRFRDLILGPRNEEEERSLAILLQGRFCPHQTDEAEARLMEKFRDGIAWLRSIDDRPLEIIRGVLGHIIRGQLLDIERFPDSAGIRALNSAAELDEYTWLGAGCVGEFWTRLCISELPAAFAKEVDHARLLGLAASYGRGLQLVNILRDLPRDLAAGRCYLPQEELRKHGRHLAELRLNPRVLDPLRAPWHDKCAEHLDSGLEYLRAITNTKLRYATALPLLLGLRTLALLRDAKWPELAAGIKISRLEVAKVLAEAAIACRDLAKLEKLCQKLRA